MRRKVSIIGAGNVGASAAERIALRRLADVVMVDIIEGLPQGKALDLNEAGPVDGYDARLTGSNGYEATKGSDIVVITSGLPRKPRERVLGMAGVLDSARMRFFIAEALGVSVENTHAFVLGGHGDTMVPLPRYSTVAGIPITELLTKEAIDAIVQRTRDGGIEVVNLLKSGSAYYAPASSIVQMVQAILLDEHRILPCAVYLQGEYGYRDLFVGVPARLGTGGLEKVVEITLAAEEKAALDRSAAAVRESVSKLAV